MDVPHGSHDAREGGGDTALTHHHRAPATDGKPRLFFLKKKSLQDIAFVDLNHTKIIITKHTYIHGSKKKKKKKKDGEPCMYAAASSDRESSDKRYFSIPLHPDCVHTHTHTQKKR